jgi:hypothetical protein
MEAKAIAYSDLTDWAEFTDAQPNRRQPSP